MNQPANVAPAAQTVQTTNVVAPVAQVVQTSNVAPAAQAVRDPSKKASVGDIKYYLHISVLVLLALLLCATAIVFLNTHWVSIRLLTIMGETEAFIIQLFFWAALGASVASSLFLAKDKDDNELESVKEKPDPSLWRYPTDIDVSLYVHRILTSGFFGVVGAAILYAGLGYFDTAIQLSNTKHRMFFIVYCFLIGLNQGDFVRYLSELSTKVFKKASGAGQS